MAEGGAPAPGRHFGFVVPELHCPFPPAISPHADEVQEETEAWASGFGIVGDGESLAVFRATRIGRLAARFHPEADREALGLLSDFYAWMFARDDACDESALGESPERLSEADARCLEVLAGAVPERGDAPLARAMGDLAGRLGPRSSPVWRRRFLRTVGEHFDSSLWEASNRANGAVPDLTTYRRMRRITGGVLVDLALTEVAEGLGLPPEVLSHPTVRSMADSSNDVACWANDLFSLEKELTRGDVHNLVVVLASHEGLPLEAAVRKAARMHDREARRFVALEGRLPSFGPALDARLGRYVASLRARMRGNLDWARESGRYRSAARRGA